MTETALLASIGPIADSVGDRRHVLEEAFVCLDRDAEASGLTFSVLDDMDDFASVLAATGKFLPTAFDRKLKPFRARDAAAIVVRDGNGLAATHAIRLYRFGVTSLADHLATLSLFYANPVEQMVRGERLIIEGEAERFASTVDESAVYVGGFWIRPDLRGHASTLAYAMPMAVRALAAAWWGPQISFSLMKRWITDAGRAQRVGEPDVYERITWIRPHVPEDSDLVLMSTQPDAAFERAETFSSGKRRLIVDRNGERQVRTG
ncbi:MAG: hypothetical protein RLO51_23745 [Thalassobaculum sp.]|uniref:hypothetical protein n=1 Tax=Thalassobaculum sp. TaxID=2022740 RepID=UPI0032EBAE96